MNKQNAAVIARLVTNIHTDTSSTNACLLTKQLRIRKFKNGVEDESERTKSTTKSTIQN